MKTRYPLIKKVILLLGVQIALFSSIANESAIAFKAGEKISYDLYYNWGVLWIHAGNAHFSAYHTTYKNQPSYLFSATGSSLKSFDKFFLVRDTFVSIINKETFLPTYYKRVVREDSYWAQDEYWFKNLSDNKVSVVTDCKRRKGERNIDTLSLHNSVTDLVTAIYKVRNTDFSKLKKNERIAFSIIFDDDDKQYDLSLTYLGKEQIELRNGEKYNCIKLKPQVIKGDVFKQEDAMTIWITDDPNRIPMMIEAKIRVGSLKVMLKNIINPKFPITSLQK